MDQSEEIIRYYDAFAENYDALVQNDRDYTAYQRIPAWLLEYWRISESLRVLDLGCGTGLGARPFLAAGCLVDGVDISPKMIEKARALPFNQLLCQSLEQRFPFQNRVYEGVILLGVMEFIHDPSALFAEINRVLKPQGLFGLTIPKKLPTDIEEELGVRSFDPAAVESLFAALGFAILRQADFQGWIYQERTVLYRGYLLQKR